MQITTKVKDTDIVVNYNIGETIEEATNLFGNDVVLSQYKKGAVLAVQAKVRNLMSKDGATPESVQESLKSWKIGVATARTVDWDKKVGKMGPDQIKALLEAIKRKKAGEGAEK